MKKLYSLTKNGLEIVSVEMDVPDFMPSNPVLNRQWLRGVIQTETGTPSKIHQRAVRKPARQARPARKLAKVAA